MPKPARDPRLVLGVPPDATPDQIRAAYRRLARELHPDVSTRPDAAERFAEVARAYERLTDPDLAAGARQAPPPVHADDPAEAAQVYDAFFRTQAQARPRKRRPGFQPIPGTLDLAIDLPVSAAEAARGLTVEIPTPDGPHPLAVPPGTTDGASLRVPGRGVRAGGGRRGDLVVRVRVVPASGAAFNPQEG